MFTYKGHSLGDYVRTILFVGRPEHKRVKRYYARTNKNDAVGQITQLERREAALEKIMRQDKEVENLPPIASVPENPAADSAEPNRNAASSKKYQARPALDFIDSESLPYSTPLPSPTTTFHLHATSISI
ncbi:hypothetical protein R3P38DRAFT_2805296 [Favolaschia claudopus]|uniref:Uncharacterized protein n=1 Tax=Favolaschia claudopus TaxID=2862362 RepID=A0AAV9ZMU4_9AGAR